MNEVGNPTPLCRQLRMRKDKPHICLKDYDGEVYLWDSNNMAGTNNQALARRFCLKVCPRWRKTPGDAARAWHSYGRKA